MRNGGMYQDRRFYPADRFQKYKTGYDLDTDAIQALVAQNPDVIYQQRLDLSVANSVSSPTVINVPGTAFAFYGFPQASAYSITTNTGTEPHEPSAFVHCRINNNRAENGFNVKSGKGFKGDFNALYLTWPAQGSIYGQIVIYKYDLHPFEFQADNRFSSVEASQVITNAGSPFTVTSTAAQLIPQLLNRKCSTIQNLGSVNIFVGDSTVSSTNGFQIAPQGVLHYRNTGALFAVTASTSNTAITVTDEV